MKILFVTAWAALATGCSGISAGLAQTIVLNKLSNYMLSNTGSAKPGFYYITDSAEFYNYFTGTKALPTTFRAPDFAQQAVLAIVLPATEKVVELTLEEAVLKQQNLQVKYKVVDTATFTTFLHQPFTLAQIPRLKNIKQVTFVDSLLRVQNKLNIIF